MKREKKQVIPLHKKKELKQQLITLDAGEEEVVATLLKDPVFEELGLSSEEKVLHYCVLHVKLNVLGMCVFVHVCVFTCVCLHMCVCVIVF